MNTINTAVTYKKDCTFVPVSNPNPGTAGIQRLPHNTNVNVFEWYFDKLLVPIALKRGSRIFEHSRGHTNEDLKTVINRGLRHRIQQ